MNPRIEIITQRKLVGIRKEMTFAQNTTGKLWQSFMPRRNEIQNNTSNDLFSLQNYPTGFFDTFNPHLEFEKWACIEVSDLNSIPEGMEQLTLSEGLYAVFFYKGAASAATPTFQYIMGTWLPQSIYRLDQRPHFEILGEKYKNESPDSEEEIWIPIMLK